MSKEVLYATNNPGKVTEVAKFLEHHGIRVVSPKDLGIDIDVAETGTIHHGSGEKYSIWYIARQVRCVSGDTEEIHAR